MAKKSIISTNWYRFNKLIVTEIGGDITLDDIIKWEQSLNNALDRIDDDTEFKILVNLRGFKAVDLEVHKRFRTVLPMALAGYGWKMGYENLFDDTIDLSIKRTRGIVCSAAAHVHPDSSTIETYETRFGKYNEHFFTDCEEAFHWIRNYNAHAAVAC